MNEPEIAYRERCQHCSGRGVIMRPIWAIWHSLPAGERGELPSEPQTMPCPVCDGEGWVHSYVSLPRLKELLKGKPMPKQNAIEELRDALHAITEALAEAHQYEIDNTHGGDSGCSYCEALNAARAILDHPREIRVKIQVRGGTVVDVTAPRGVTVTVIDYDGGQDEDDDGKPCEITDYEGVV